PRRPGAGALGPPAHSPAAGSAEKLPAEYGFAPSWPWRWMMPSDLPRLFLARHGDTAWTDSRQRTGRTDLPLNERGEQHARQLGERLRRFSFARVFTSPLQRAAKTCALAGFGEVAEADPDLVEWDYGRYEGKLTKDILKERPGWEMFR